jgi:hypothetical protein
MIKTYTVRCVEGGCREYALYEYTRKTDPRVKDWRCARHTRPEEVLTIGASRTTTLTVVELSHGKFWRADGKSAGSGFTYGPGYRAFAGDFPAGTRLVVSVQIERGGTEIDDKH